MFVPNVIFCAVCICLFSKLVGWQIERICRIPCSAAYNSRIDNVVGEHLRTFCDSLIKVSMHQRSRGRALYIAVACVTYFLYRFIPSVYGARH